MIKMTIIRTLVIILGSVTKSLPLRDINTLKSVFFSGIFLVLLLSAPAHTLSSRPQRFSAKKREEGSEVVFGS